MQDFIDIYARFRQYLSALGPISDAEMDLIVASTTTKTIKKRLYLLQEGDVCKHVAWIAKGCVRMFVEDIDRKEHILSFGFDGEFVADRASLGSGLPSQCNIEALEDTNVILLTVEAVDQLLKTVPVMMSAYNKATRELLAHTQLRMTASMSMSAEEKFNMMEQLCPQALDRVPQHMIASYLGMTPATLSRIRNRRADEDTA